MGVLLLNDEVCYEDVHLSRFRQSQFCHFHDLGLVKRGFGSLRSVAGQMMMMRRRKHKTKHHDEEIVSEFHLDKMTNGHSFSLLHSHSSSFSIFCDRSTHWLLLLLLFFRVVLVLEGVTHNIQTLPHRRTFHERLACIVSNRVWCERSVHQHIRTLVRARMLGYCSE